jgi:hypothetical protein
MKDNVPDDYSVLIFKRIYLIQIAIVKYRIARGG